MNEFIKRKLIEKLCSVPLINLNLRTDKTYSKAYKTRAHSQPVVFTVRPKHGLIDVIER